MAQLREVYEQVAGVYKENSRQRNAFESVYAFYADALNKATNGDLETLQQAKQVSVLAAGPTAHLDALSLAILLPHAHIAISDLEETWIRSSRESLESFLRMSTRRGIQNDFLSRITCDVADAREPAQFAQENDLTVLRNPGGSTPGTADEVDFDAMFSTARQITRSGGLLLISSRTEEEAAIHQRMLLHQPMTMVYNDSATETNVYDFFGDAHLFAARV